MSKRRSARTTNDYFSEVPVSNVVPLKRDTKPLKPLNKAQERFLENLESYELNLCFGSAGSGKTFLAAAKAAEALEAHKVSKIIVTRPAVEADGEEMGFLPGELDEKFAPWFEPFRDALELRLGHSTVEYHLKRGTIVPKPLAYMRGCSFKDSWVIMDEAQNCTPGQMKMFLTRLGEGCKMTILGDIKQSDIRGISGMEDALQKLGGMPEIGVHEFQIEDCVRHGLVRKILEKYER